MNHIRRINNIVNGYLDMAYFIDDMQELHDICLAKFFFLISESTKNTSKPCIITETALFFRP